MNLSKQSLESTPSTVELTQTDAPASNVGNSMEEYYQLQTTLLLATLALTVISFIPVWIVYSLNTALNYLLGAGAGVVYLRLLAKDVERLSQNGKRLGSKGLVIFAGLIILATQWQELQLMPIFLGFMTYKAAILVYTLKTTLFTQDKVDK